MSKRAREDCLQMEHSRNMLDVWLQNMNDAPKFTWTSSYPYLQSPDMEREYDFLGDGMDECSDDLCSELKSIALWGGYTQFKSVLLAYNDIRCSEALIASLPTFMTTASDKKNTNDHTLQLANLIARNRFGLMALEISGREFAVTQDERLQQAIKRYKSGGVEKNTNAILRYPPKKVVSRLWSSIEKQCADAAGGSQVTEPKEVFDNLLNGQTETETHPMMERQTSALMNLIEDLQQKMDDHLN